MQVALGQGATPDVVTSREGARYHVVNGNAIPADQKTCGFFQGLQRAMDGAGKFLWLKQSRIDWPVYTWEVDGRIGPTTVRQLKKIISTLHPIVQRLFPPHETPVDVAEHAGEITADLKYLWSRSSWEVATADPQPSREWCGELPAGVGPAISEATRSLVEAVEATEKSSRSWAFVGGVMFSLVVAAAALAPEIYMLAQGRRWERGGRRRRRR